MQKETIEKMKAASENKCRVYFDQLATLRNQQEQVAIALEQERGRVQGYNDVLENWEPPKVEMPQEDVDLLAAETPARAGEPLIPVPPKAKTKKEK